MTKYLEKSFSVLAPTSQQYRDNWDAIFKKPKEEALLEQVEALETVAETDDSE